MFDRKNPNLILGNFSDADIDTIEAAYSELIGDDEDPSGELICHLSNCFVDGMTVDRLVEAATDLGWDGVRRRPGS